MADKLTPFIMIDHVLTENFTDAKRSQHAMITAQSIDVSEPNLHQAEHKAHQEQNQQSDLLDYTTGIAQPLASTPSLAGLPTKLQVTQAQVPAPTRNNRGRPRRSIEQDTGMPPPRGRKSASPKKSALSQVSSSPRRSLRVRSKKVSYAESDGSSIASREPSPEKSDISGFSPSKSDLSASPDKSDELLKVESRELRQETSELDDSKSQRRSELLGGRIGDWAHNQRPRSGSRVGNPHTPAPRTHGSHEPAISTPKFNRPANALNQPPSLIGLQKHAQASEPQLQRTIHAGANERPPTRHGPPVQQSFSVEDGNVAITQFPALPNFLPDLPAQNLEWGLNFNATNAASAWDVRPSNHYDGQTNTAPAQSEVDRTWLINTPAFNFLSNLSSNSSYLEMFDNNQSSVERKDSVLDNTSLVQPHQKPVEMSAFPNYDRMRRSFSAAADLTPPPITGKTSSSTDPQKRKLPTSSPLPAAKRVRLSLPEESQTPIVYEDDPQYTQATNMSSPSKLPTHTHRQSNADGRKLSNDTAEAMPTPAPILAPTAMMYVPSQQDLFAGEDAGSTALELPTHAGEDDGIMDEIGTQSSDIDWEDLLNEYML